MKRFDANIVILISFFSTIALIIGIAIGNTTTRKSSDVQVNTQPTIEIRPTGRVAILIDDLNNQDRKISYDAVKELQSMGPNAIAAIPALVNLATYYENGIYNDADPYLAAVGAIPDISKEAALPYLIEDLKDPMRRCWAAFILGDFKDIANPAIPELVQSLRDMSNAQTRDEMNACYQAAIALANIRPKGLSALIGEMANHDPLVRKAAVRATPSGINGYPAADELAIRLSDDEQGVRWLAAVALGDIGKEAEDYIFFLEEAAKYETDGSTRIAIDNAINKIQNPAPTPTRRKRTRP